MNYYTFGKRERMNYKITIQFDGTRYKGFQKQTGTKENDMTIQGKLESVLKTFLGHEAQLIGCGRTDAGVHAENYIANFITEEKLDLKALMLHFDKYLPEDIFVKDVVEASERFHARHNASSKIYRYSISTDRGRNVFTRKYSYKLEETLDIEKMKKAAELFVGEYDFAGFSNLKSKKKSTVRKIYDIKIHTSKSGEIFIDMEGNGFLQNMVRIIAGTIIEVGTGKRNPNTISEILSHKKREEAGFMVPPQGLMLLEVKYQ